MASSIGKLPICFSYVLFWTLRNSNSANTRSPFSTSANTRSPFSTSTYPPKVKTNSTHGNTLFPHTERGIFHTHISIVLVYKIFVYNQYILFVGFSLFEGKNRNKIDDYFGENYGYTFSNPNS